MAQGVCLNSQVEPDNCCVAGRVFFNCVECGGSPKLVGNCQKCNGSGAQGFCCPAHVAYASTGKFVNVNNSPTFGGNSGFRGNPGHGQQGCGSTSGH